MNVGDRVRLLYHREEGVITKLLSDAQVEVEIEDGFRIPVLKSELVVIAKEEKMVFGEKKPAGNLAQATAQKIWAETGFYLAFVPLNDYQLSVYLVNNTDYEIPFTLGEYKEGNYSGIATGQLTKRNVVKVHEVNIEKFERWTPLLIQALFFRQGHVSLKEPLVRKMKFSAESFFKSKRKAPIIDKDAFLFQLDQEAVAVRPEAIKESMIEGGSRDVSKKVNIPVPKPAQEIDLHINALTDKGPTMNNSQMLNLQLDVFEKRLDEAIASNMEEIIFIHGVGNGVLKNEIQKRLSKNPNIKFFQDAKKEKFGYGATLVRLR